MVLRWTSLPIWALGLASVAAGAEEPKILQVSVHLPAITAYLHVPEQNGGAPHLTASDISAVTIQGQGLKLDNVTATPAIAYTLLLDVSGSIKNSAQFRNAIARWVDGLHPDDHLEIFTFGDCYQQIGDQSSDKTTLQAGLQTVTFGQQSTILYSAVKKALAYAGRAEPKLPDGRMIVLVTDGKDDPPKDEPCSDQPGKDKPTDVTEADVQQEIRESRVPVYTIGYSRLKADQDLYLGKLKSFADTSRGFYDCAASTQPSGLCSSDASIPASLDRLKRTMGRIFALHLTCSRCQASENHDLQISLQSGMTAQFPVALTLLPIPPDGIPIWVYIVAGLLLLAIAVLVGWFVLRGKKPAPEPLPEPVEPLPIPTPEPGMPMRFTVVSGEKPGQVYTVKLAGKLVIGRDSGCEVVLPGDKEISDRHCELARVGGRIEIVDLGSTNGTLLNGALVVARQRVEDGDLIRVGRTEVRVRFGER